MLQRTMFTFVFLWEYLSHYLQIQGTQWKSCLPMPTTQMLNLTPTLIFDHQNEWRCRGRPVVSTYVPCLAKISSAVLSVECEQTRLNMIRYDTVNLVCSNTSDQSTTRIKQKHLNEKQSKHKPMSIIPVSQVQSHDVWRQSRGYQKS